MSLSTAAQIARAVENQKLPRIERKIKQSRTYKIGDAAKVHHHVDRAIKLNRRPAALVANPILLYEFSRQNCVRNQEIAKEHFSIECFNDRAGFELRDDLAAFDARCGTNVQPLWVNNAPLKKQVQFECKRREQTYVD